MYLQRSGGPIGARLTMACSRVVMMDWGEEYTRILKEAGLTITLFKIYVDDVRQANTVLKMGSRYDDKSRRMVVTEEARLEDEKRKQEGESSDARMVRVLARVAKNLSLRGNLDSFANISPEIA